MKEYGTKFKTKIKKLAFIQSFAQQLKNLPYDTMQLQKIKDFLKKKAQEYKIPLDNVVSLDASANYIHHTLPVCNCVECQETLNLMVSNTIVHPTQLFMTLESTISELQVPELVNQIKTFHQMKCKHAKNVVAAYILDVCPNLT